mgnify:CR=1 FL=1
MNISSYLCSLLVVKRILPCLREIAVFSWRMDLEKLRAMEYIKCADLLAKLIDLDVDTKERIHKCFQNMGIKNFFLHLELIDLSPETCEKLKSIKSIIEIFDDEGGQE